MLDTPNAITGPVVAVRAIVIHRQIVLRDPVERPQQVDAGHTDLIDRARGS
jgi:hypothetical protein